MNRKSKYKRLEEYLSSLDVKEISLSIEDIENIIEEPLPKSARMRTWWSNDPESGHSQAYSWTRAGYTVSLKGDMRIFRKKTMGKAK